MGHQERRTLLLAQHKRLRELIVTVSETAGNVLGSHESQLPERVSALRVAIETFAEDLRAHLAAEEQLLGPILERIDAWGPTRLELLRAEHAHQRAVLHTLDISRKLAPRDLAKRTRALIIDVLLDIEAEERDLLAESLYRDDTIVVDQSDA